MKNILTVALCIFLIVAIMTGAPKENPSPENGYFNVNFNAWTYFNTIISDFPTFPPLPHFSVPETVNWDLDFTIDTGIEEEGFSVFSLGMYLSNVFRQISRILNNLWEYFMSFNRYAIDSTFFLGKIFVWLFDLLKLLGMPLFEQTAV